MTAPNHEREYHILIVEDDSQERQALANVLTTEGYRVSTADSVDKALGYLPENIHIVITDLVMGDLSGLDLLKYWKAKDPNTPFLMMTGLGSTQAAVEAIKAGAFNYLTKPLELNALLLMLKNMLPPVGDTPKEPMLQNHSDEKGGLSNIIGCSPKMQRVFELIRRTSQAFSTVLILGESGTGKELVAEAIHQLSPRRNGPFNAVNCAAIPASLAESELFGHEKGAFTGAIERRTGRFESAHGGTLFIDEIGDFDISLQVKLLRVMETRTLTPVGGTKEIKVDTRVLAATSRDLRELIAQGRFREDLYYRLNILTIELPPLRERVEDIPILVKSFMERVNQQNGSSITGISPELIVALQHYHWPGNVRELLNIVERMMVLSDKSLLELADLPAFIRTPVTLATPATTSSSPQFFRSAEPLPRVTEPPVNMPQLTLSPPHSSPLPTINPPPDTQPKLSGEVEQFITERTLEELEKIAINLAMQRLHNHRIQVAQALGISVRTLQRKLNPPTGEQENQDQKPPETRNGPDSPISYLPSGDLCLLQPNDE